MPNKNNVIEVKAKIFELDEDIPKEISYDGKLFVQDRHQGIINNKEIKYRYKKTEKMRENVQLLFAKLLSNIYFLVIKF